MQRNFLKDIIKPRRLEVEIEENNYGKFIATPLERGYGTTIGNSLRRILLSSLPGAAITCVKINGVKHEFSAIDGCIEDVTEIILNLKQVILELHEKEEVTLFLSAKGPCEVTAGMITGDLSAKIINPELHIATLNSDGNLEIELTAKIGKGYVTSEVMKLNLGDTSLPIGTILIDSIFSPVVKVNHTVTNARVGQRTDYDKLTLEVWTNGSISPTEAVKTASIILRDQLGVFVGAEDIIEEVKKPQEEEVRRPKLNEQLFRRIDEFELSVRSSNCLENANIKYIGELVQKTEQEMLRTKNFGRKSLDEIREKLIDIGLCFDMKLENFPSREELDKMSDQNNSVHAD